MTKEQLYRDIEVHYRKNFNDLCNKYARYLGAKFRAEDVVQEGYLRAMQYWDSFSDQHDLNNWIGRIIGNCIHDYRRGEILGGMSLDDLSEEETAVEAEAFPAVIKEQVEKRINAKSERDALILTLALINQYRPKDIERLTGEKSNAVRQIVFRFREELKKEFKWSA